ncbi:MAG: hypothetical protein R3E48_03685 [Burkholderiaceae bacterium]
MGALKWRVVASGIILVSMLAACGGGGGDSSGSGDTTPTGDTGGSGTPTAKELDVSGQVDLPGFAETGARWLKISDPNSEQPLYEGPTAANGSYSATITAPVDLDRLVIEAVAPQNPGAYGMAVVSLGATAGANGLKRAQTATRTAARTATKGSPVQANIDAQSTARGMALTAAGRLREGSLAFDTSEQTRVDGIATALASDGVQSCPAQAVAGGPKPRSYDGYLSQCVSWATPMRRAEYDDTLRNDGLRAAQQIATVKILPGNRFGRGFGWANGGVKMLRWMMHYRIPALTTDGYATVENYRLPYEDLVKAVDLILSAERGNCRENALFGAYLASRISNFKQVAAIAVYQERSVYDYSHALTLACRKGTETFDIYNWNFSNITASSDTRNNALLAADCTIIDSWGGETIPLAEFLDKNVGRSVKEVMRIVLPPDSERITLPDSLLNAPAPALKVAALGKPALEAAALGKDETPRGECYFGSTPDACSSFTVAGGERCGDEVDNDGDGEVDEGCPAATPPTDYVVWYMDNVACWSAPRVYATNRAGFDQTQRTCDIPGGGIDCNIDVEKVALRDGFATLAEAQSWFCGQVKTNWYHYWCNSRGARVEVGGGQLYTLAMPCDLSQVPYEYP